MMKFIAKYKNLFGHILLILFVALILMITVRGLPGNPTPKQLNTPYWEGKGPFELSNERGRFALIYSIIEDHSFHLQPVLANFAAPDIGYHNNSYVSLFAPSVSILGIPGYLVGKYFNVSQYGTFLWMSLFALFNVLLIRAISIRLGAHSLAATISGFAFLFATPAFAYAVTLYEHHVSTFFILLSLYLLIRYNNLISLIAIWIIYAFAFTVDYPNLFMMFPIALAAFFRSGMVERIQRKFTLRISLPRVLTVLAVVIPLSYFLWFNQVSYNNPLTISGTVARVSAVNANGTPIYWGSNVKTQAVKTEKSSNLPPPSFFSFFLPRNMLNGFYILLISPDRGILTYAPIILFVIVGAYIAIKKKHSYTSVLLGVIGTNFILYSMWGDPYGGWAFGSRYLIPTYAISAIFISRALTSLGRHRLFLLLFFAVFSYSVIISTLGAITSNGNPPKIEADAIANLSHQPVLYTYMRNVNELNANISQSFVFRTYVSHYLSAWQYYSYIAIFILILSSSLIFLFHIVARKSYLKGGRHEI